MRPGKGTRSISRARNTSWRGILKVPSRTTAMSLSDTAQLCRQARCTARPATRSLSSGCTTTNTCARDGQFTHLTNASRTRRLLIHRADTGDPGATHTVSQTTMICPNTADRKRLDMDPGPLQGGSRTSKRPMLFRYLQG